MNNLTIAGNVGNTRTGEYNGKPVLNFSVAVNEGKDRTTWFDCALWGDRVNSVGQYIEKGGRIAVTGSVSAEAYDGKGKLKVFVRDVTLMGRPSEAAPAPVITPETMGGDDLDDDLPFAAFEAGTIA